MIYLYVRQAFAPYSVGSLITNPTDVTAVLNGANASNVETVYAFYVGYTWRIQINVTNNDGSPASLANQTIAGELSLPFNPVSVDLTIANNSIVIVGAASFIVNIPTSVTGNVPSFFPQQTFRPGFSSRQPIPQNCFDMSWPLKTKIQLFCSDDGVDRTLIGILPILPLKP